jgi:hypothetical protein
LFETARSFKIYVVESLEPIKRARDALRRPHAGYRRHNDRDDFMIAMTFVLLAGCQYSEAAKPASLPKVQNRS